MPKKGENSRKMFLPTVYVERRIHTGDPRGLQQEESRKRFYNFGFAGRRGEVPEKYMEGTAEVTCGENAVLACLVLKKGKIRYVSRNILLGFDTRRKRRGKEEKWRKYPTFDSMEKNPNKTFCSYAFFFLESEVTMSPSSNNIAYDSIFFARKRGMYLSHHYLPSSALPPLRLSS